MANQGFIKGLSGVKLVSEDLKWMRLAIKLAQKAAEQDEVPVGALIVDKNGDILSKAYNYRESLKSPLGHAEILALHRASKKQKNWRLEGCTLYVTLEPCLMCAGALVQSRMDRVVFGALDPKGGAVRSLYQLLEDSRLNHQVQVTGPLMAAECGGLLTDYFKEKRKQKKGRT
ncbi:MAG TPA: tRNA adenosine(34) deaminase TadA [Pseudobdellovibrionaceae bacterium]|nr:tRNA adenosine(34) deaminase TadA [Pseudobdellovibrionaceae bacterium]